MNTLYPKDTIAKYVEGAILSSDFTEVLPVVTSLLRQVSPRTDFIPILASLLTSSNIKTKLLTYLLLIRNIRDSTSMIILNQVLKDLSHSNWVVNNLALLSLINIHMISDDIIDYDTVERSVLAAIKYGNVRMGSAALRCLRPGRWLGKVGEIIDKENDSIAAMNYVTFTAQADLSSHQRAEEILSKILRRDIIYNQSDKTSLVLIDYIEFIGATKKPSIAMIEIFKNVITSKNLLCSAYFSILPFLTSAELDLSIFRFHLQRNRGQSDLILKVMEKFPFQLEKLFDDFILLDNALILTGLLRYIKCTKRHLDGIFEILQNQILTSPDQILSSQLEVAVNLSCHREDVFNFFNTIIPEHLHLFEEKLKENSTDCSKDFKGIAHTIN